MKKRVRIIAISVTALFLSICIPFVSLGITKETVWTNWDYFFKNNSLRFTNFAFNVSDKVSIPHLDTLDTYDFSSFMSDYIESYSGGYYSTLSGTPSFSYYVRYFNQEQYNTFNTYGILLSDNVSSYGIIFVRFYDESNSLLTTIRLDARQMGNSGHIINDYVDMIYNTSLYPSNYTIQGQLLTISSFTLKNVVKRIEIEFNHYFNGSLFGNYIIPTYKIGYEKLTYDEWEQKQIDMHEQTLNEISQIGDDISRVGDDVSRIGSEISQFHNDLTSLPSDFDVSQGDSTVSQIGTDVSNIAGWENDINDDINSYVSDIENFDTSALESYVEEGLNPLTNDTQDIAYESFLKNMYDSLGMGTYFVVFAPFAIIFVLFKFVLGGIT